VHPLLPTVTHTYSPIHDLHYTYTFPALHLHISCITPTKENPTVHPLLPTVTYTYSPIHFLHYTYISCFTPTHFLHYTYKGKCFFLPCTRCYLLLHTPFLLYTSYITPTRDTYPFMYLLLPVPYTCHLSWTEVPLVLEG